MKARRATSRHCTGGIGGYMFIRLRLCMGWITPPPPHCCSLGRGSQGSCMHVLQLAEVEPDQSLLSYGEFIFNGRPLSSTRRVSVVVSAGVMHNTQHATAVTPSFRFLRMSCQLLLLIVFVKHGYCNDCRCKLRQRRNIVLWWFALTSGTLYQLLITTLLIPL